MKAGLRQGMAWLHTWCGLACGWLLCAIMFTGTLSVFREPITRWMEAATLPAMAAGSQADPLAHATRILASRAGGAAAWDIDLPARPGQPLRLAWHGSDGQEHEAWIDPVSGDERAPPRLRQTEGGRHFMSFHYTLHGGLPGYWLVGAISLCMLVALVSGVVVHKRIFKDFFTFRRGKGQRSWLDAHNATGVLTLPFLFMICYTGLAFFYTSYMPWPLQAVYGADDGAYRRYQAELKPAPPAPASAGTGQDAGLALRALVSRARMLTGQEADRIAIERPGAAGGIVRVSGRRETGAAPRLLTHASLVVFDARSGAVLQAVPAFEAGTAAHQVHEAIETLHKADFGGWSMKWLYFVSGLAGTAMVATGTLLFAIKRSKKSEHEFGAATARVYLWVEALNVAALAGIALASIVYLYANRLIPAALAGRESWEIRAFFLAWAASLAHARWRGPRRAWIGQLALAALLCLGLPLLNRATTGQHLWAYAERGLMQQAALELTVLGLGLALGYAAWAVRRGWGHAAPAPANARRPAAGPNPPTAAHRWQVGSRVLAASVGGYGVSALALSWLALALPTAGVSPAVAVLAATLASFVLYPLIVLGVFSARSAGRAWGALALVGALCTALLLGWRA
ncbi:PepSY domain-containing protein [Achromobacter deleyi]|uniref:PepSY domain-containing protein n=1 Tax=Achromobacter deleyi TaxID=1353891 RepID=A0A7T4B7V1_9BURK|nr:PepSY-associated TM helix domain-containing protein [Achromobacter deleyi]QQB37323.1 PepSY domain-containing protein [Achromobacter deleyi]